LAGLGIGLFPDFAFLTDLRRRKLVAVLEPDGIDIGAVWFAYPVQRYLASRVREFLDLAVDQFGREAPWMKVGGPKSSSAPSMRATSRGQELSLNELEVGSKGRRAR